MNGEQLPTSGQMIGSVLLGRYRIVRELAKGGMGIVYLARAEGAVGFVKPYVIKLVLPEHADNQRFVAMFIREANILSNLRHPGVVSVIELGARDEDGALVMVLEYVRGYHLGQWAKYVRLKKRAIPFEILLQLMIDVLDALHYAHTMVHPDGTPMHIVHRDISPSNILLDEDGRARLLDFGVARMRGGNQEYHTQVKGFVGKLMYSAPELFSEAEATVQSDCYSCAVVLHEILSGRNVFRADNQAATLNRVLHHQPEALAPLRPELPPGLDAVLQRGLAKLPQQRFADAHEFAMALRALQREPESVVRGRLAALLKQDFGQDMAEMLGLESLADRDEAWRRLSHFPTGRVPTFGLGEQHARELASQLIHDSDRAGPSQRPTRAPSRGFASEPSLHSLPPRDSPSYGPTLREGVGLLALPPTPPLPALLTDPSAAPISSLPPEHTAPFRAPFAGARALPAFFAGLLVAGALVSVLWLARKPESAAQPALPVPQIRVVTEPQEPLAEATPEAAREPAASEPPLAAPHEGESSSRATSERRERKSRSGPDPVGLTRAFRRQQGKIEACFASHAAALEGLPLTQLEFDLSASGAVERVRVLPAAVADTALGKCLAKVASATHFAAQGRPISFAIPIKASRSGSP